MRAPLPTSFDDPQESHDPIALAPGLAFENADTLSNEEIKKTIGSPPASAMAVPRGTTQQAKPHVGMDKRGVLEGDDMDSAWRVACAVAASGMVPQAFQGKPGAVLVAMQSAKERGLNPWNALQQTANINGRSSNWGETPLGEVFRAGVLKSYEEYWIDKEGKRLDPLDLTSEPWGAVCEGERMDGLGGRVVRLFTQEQALKAKLMNNPKKDTWIQYLKRMLQMRARGWFLKDAAPEIVAGIPMPEYDDFEPEPKAEKVEREGSLVSKLKGAVDGLGEENQSGAAAGS